MVLDFCGNSIWCWSGNMEAMILNGVLLGNSYGVVARVAVAGLRGGVTGSAISRGAKEQKQK